VNLWTYEGPQECPEDERGKHSKWKTVLQPGPHIKQVCGLCGLATRTRRGEQRVQTGGLL
jgi:hypothetical protein